MAQTNTMGGERPRNTDDAYFTPDALALAIAGRVRETFGIVSQIVEPSAGMGAFVRAARATWPVARITAHEPNLEPRTFPANTADPLFAAGATKVTTRRWEDCGNSWAWPEESGAIDGRVLIIGNPPYNLLGDGRGDTPTTAERHALLALDRMRDGDVLAFLLRLAFLGGGGRIERLHAKHPLAALWPVTPRPSFTEDGKSDSSEYGVFVWEKGYDRGANVRPLRWR